MGWRADLNKLRDALQPSVAAEASRPAPVKQPRIKREWIPFSVQLNRPLDGNPGEIAVGAYSVADGVVTVLGNDSKPIGTHTLLACEDAFAMARMIMRNTREPASFGRRLDYKRAGVA